MIDLQEKIKVRDIKKRRKIEVFINVRKNEKIVEKRNGNYFFILFSSKNICKSIIV